VVASVSVTAEDEMLIVTKDGIMIRMKISEINEIGRNTQGVRLIKLKSETDAVVAVAKLVSEKIEEEI
jgi:DNA gyrase subunit A